MCGEHDSQTPEITIAKHFATKFLQIIGSSLRLVSTRNDKSQTTGHRRTMKTTPIHYHVKCMMTPKEKHDLVHLLFTCVFAKEAWKLMSIFFNLDIKLSDIVFGHIIYDQM